MNYYFYTVPTILLVVTIVQGSINFFTELTKCRWTDTGYEYLGNIDFTASGQKCINWTNTDAIFYYQNELDFPNGNIESNNNFCRNPATRSREPWCVTGKNKKENCNVPKCNNPAWWDCRDTYKGVEYKGTRYKTMSSKRCKSWLNDVANDSVCRNPFYSIKKTPWCFVDDANTVSELCDVPKCLDTGTRLNGFVNDLDHTYGIEDNIYQKVSDNFHRNATVVIKISEELTMISKTQLFVLSTKYRATCQTNFNYYSYCKMAQEEFKKKTTILKYHCYDMVKSVIVLSPIKVKKFKSDIKIEFGKQIILPTEKEPEIDKYLKWVSKQLSGLPSFNDKMKVPKNSGYFVLISRNTFPVIIDEAKNTIGAVSLTQSNKYIGFLANEHLFDIEYRNMIRAMFQLVYDDPDAKPEMLTEILIKKLYKNRNENNAKHRKKNFIWNAHRTIYEENVEKVLKLVNDGMNLIVGIKPWAYNFYTQSLSKSEIKMLLLNFGLWPSKSYSQGKFKIVKKMNVKLMPLPILLDIVRTNENKLINLYQTIKNHFKILEPILENLLNKVSVDLKNSLRKFYEKYITITPSLVTCLGDRKLSEKEKAIIKMMNLIFLNPVNNRFISVPGVNLFPGMGRWPNRRETYRIKLNAQYKNEVYFTGLYMRPNSDISVLMNTNANIFCYVQLNVVFNNMVNRDYWARWPDIYKQWEIVPNTRLYIYFPFGGIISVKCPENDNITMDLEITGAYQLAFYDKRSGLDNVQINKLTAPWLILSGDYVTMVMPIIAMRNQNSPKKMIDLFDSLVEEEYHLRGYDIRDRRKEVIVADAQTEAGYMHAGYPIGTPMLDVANPIKRKDYLFSSTAKEKGFWGIAHEVGHNLESPVFDIICSSDSINNIFSVRVNEMLTKLPAWELGVGWLEGARFVRMVGYIMSGNFQQWCGKYFVALGTFIQLRNEFGWEFYRQLFRRFDQVAANNMADNKSPKQEAVIDLWILESSRLVQLDLRPHFDYWHWPISENVNNDISQLKLKTLFLPDDMLTKTTPARTNQILAKYAKMGKIIRQTNINWKKNPNYVGPLQQTTFDIIKGKKTILNWKKMQ